jgi:signal peptidase II
MPKTNNSITSKLYLVGGIVALILVLDQALKIYIKTHFQPGEEVSVFGNWFVLEYIENQGMAFGTTFGNKIWHKLALSIFRIVAIGAICYYWWKQAKQGARTEFLLAIGLILAGAAGNLIDSMFYDFIFPYDPCISFNHLKGSGIQTDCGVFGQIETRHTGFLLGNVVDMFKFHAVWPSWMPLIGDSEVFPAIWNVADSAISVGVGMVFIRQRTYFKKDEKDLSTTETVVEENKNTPKSEL